MAIYTIEGVDYPSVTTVLDILDKSSALMPWAVNCAIQYVRENKGMFIDDDSFEELLENAKTKYRDISDEAKDIGSELHGLIQHYINCGLEKEYSTNYSNELFNSFVAFLEWEEQNDVKWLKSELQVFDVDNCYAGTLDAICEINGELTLIDFKSSKGFYDTYSLQIAAYLKAYNKQHNCNIKKCGILRLDKTTGIPEYRDYSDNLENNYDSFLHLLNYYYAAKKRRLKNNPRVKLRNAS